MNITVEKTTPSQSSPLHRHQSSLEGILDFSLRQPLTAEQRQQAKRKFYHVVQHFEAAETTQIDRARKRGSQYNRSLLVRLTYEHARSAESQDIFLRTFFRSMPLSLDSEDFESDRDVDLGSEATEAHLRSLLIGFADYLLDNFFLPCKNVTFLLPSYSDLSADHDAWWPGLSKSIHQEDAPTIPCLPFGHPEGTGS